MNIEALIYHLQDNSFQTIGIFSIYKDLKNIFNCKTLELPWKNNKRMISRIKEDTYIVKKRFSKKHGWHFHIINVPGRDLILIHPANYVKQLLGCVAVGRDFVDINKDGLKDVTYSKDTMKKLLSLLPDEFTLKIV